MILPLVLLAACAAAADPGGGKPAISSDITVRSKAGGPTLSVPPPSPSRPIVDEVLSSLTLGRGTSGPGVETIRVVPEDARLSRPFPEAPFLALSPENIRARYDSWTFEVIDSEGIVYRSEGVGRLEEPVVWDGARTDGRLAIAPGQSYRYRFSGQRGGRAFRIESEPVTLRSFTHREYVGETRLEVALADIFEPGKAVFAPQAARYLDSMSEQLRTCEQRANGSYRLELHVSEPLSKSAKARAKALTERFSKSLLVPPQRIAVAVLPAQREEALAALLPPSKGASFRQD